MTEERRDMRSGGTDKPSKEEMRRLVLGRRNALPAEEHAARSRIVCGRILSFLETRFGRPEHPAGGPAGAGRSAPALAAFMPGGSEIDIRPVIEWAWGQGVAVLLPKTGPRDSLTLHRVTGYAQLEPGRFGLWEPKADIPAWPPGGRIDVMLVPGIAFDRSGGRIGYGRGYYDRLLGELARQGPLPPLIAPAFSLQLVERVPAEEHDAAVDFIACEDGWIATGARGRALSEGPDPAGPESFP